LNIEQIYKEIVAIIPVYTESGNATRILFTDREKGIGSLILCQHLESIKQKWARMYAVDLKAQARILQSRYHRSAPLPFYAPDGKIFVPFKLRLAKVAGDTIYGYICLEVIAQIKMISRSDCLLMLTDGAEFPIYSNAETAKLSYYLGNEIARDYFHGERDDKQEILSALHTLRRFLLE